MFPINKVIKASKGQEEGVARGVVGAMWQLLPAAERSPDLLPAFQRQH